MTWRDKLEIGLTDDASFRKDNLPDEQVRGAEVPKGKGRSPEIPAARHDAEDTAGPSTPHEHDRRHESDRPDREDEDNAQRPLPPRARE
jgi:hypothetical protein